MRRDPPTAIRASAGSGKTFQLTNRLLRLLASGVPPDRVLAITFTRKAAGEILERVFHRLAGAARDEAGAATLAEQLGVSLSAPDALALLGSLARSLHRLRISTLDSFFHGLASRFAPELELAPAWRIVDERTERRVRDDSIRELLEKGDRDGMATLLRLLSRGEVRRSVHDQIFQTVQDHHALYLESAPEAWGLPELPPDISEAEFRRGCEALARLELPRNKSGKVDGRWKRAHREAQERLADEDWLDFVSSGIGAAIVEERGRFGSREIPDEVEAAYAPMLRRARARLVAQLDQQTRATHRLLKLYDDIFRPRQQRTGALRFEDITRRLAERSLLGRLDEVYYRLDGRIDHLLLDEFQDTSRPQWQVLAPLAQEITAQSGDGEHTFFCVGDRKQAIYGWRGGAAEIFDALDDALPGLRWESLVVSRRSSPVIIDVVNRVFDGPACGRALHKHAEAVDAWLPHFHRHQTARTELPGYATLDVAPRAERGEERQETVTLRHAADLVVRLVEEAPAATTGILVRRNQAVTRLIHELRLRDIWASEEGGNPLTDSAAVQLLLSLVTLADQPSDRVAHSHLAWSILADPLRRVAGKATFDPDALARRLRRELLERGVAATLQPWVDELLPHCNARDRRRLEQLIELAWEWNDSLRPRDFVEHVRQQRVEDPSAAPVRVMTIHQAKGLEFDRVVLPELDPLLVGLPPRVIAVRPDPLAPPERVIRYPNARLRALHPPLEDLFQGSLRERVGEGLNLLYVALTRAVHALHAIVAPSSREGAPLTASPAGILRAALTTIADAIPGERLFEAGDPEWWRHRDAGETEAKAGPEAAAEAPFLPPAAPEFRRRLPRESPSSLEGATGRLRDRLTLSDRRALAAGSLLHAWAERIEWIEDVPQDDELLPVARETGASLSEREVHDLLREFRRALEQPAIRALLSRPDPAPGADRVEVVRERPFAIRLGDRLLQGAFDRLVLHRSRDRTLRAEIIDWKSDSLPPDEAAIRRRVDFYRPQMDAYRQAVTALTGVTATEVTARLAFLRLGAVRELPDESPPRGSR